MCPSSSVSSASADEGLPLAAVNCKTNELQQSRLRSSSSRTSLLLRAGVLQRAGAGDRPGPRLWLSHLRRASCFDSHRLTMAEQG